MAKKVFTTRLDEKHIAKAIDGLVANGYSMEQLDNMSNIIRLVFYFGLTVLNSDLESDASEQAQVWITSRSKQNRAGVDMSLKDILTRG